MIKTYFDFDNLKTSYKQEIIAGFTTFATMSYIIVVNPAILSAAGLPKDASMIATIITAFFGTLLMGVYAKRPFAIAPYMGENAFIAYTVVNVMGYSWQTAIGAIFISGVLFTILTLSKIRQWVANALPTSMKAAFAVGIGLFILLIGLVEAKMVTVGNEAAPLSLGDISSHSFLLALLGFLMIVFLNIRKIPGSFLISIIFITILGMFLGYTPFPNKIISMPPSIEPILFKLDILGALQWGFISVILSVFVLDFVDTMGTLIGLSMRAKLLDENGNLPEIEKPMLVDALSTVVAGLVGTTTAGAYLESAAGIEAGGKTGFTAVVISLLFLLSLFFAPFVTSIPAYAYAPALIMVGIFMLEPIKEIDFSDYTEFVPAAVTIIMMSYTFNMGIGITAGFVIYPIVKIFAGRWKEIHLGMWILFIISLAYFLFKP